MKHTISIGIPTLNGATHIGMLIADLLKQNLNGLKLNTITIHADGCTDGTQAIVRNLSVKNPFIRIIDSKIRVGKSQGINNLFKTFNSDVAIILDDDIRVPDPDFLKKISLPILIDKVDLVSCPMYPINYKGIIARSLRAGTIMKEKTIQTLRDGQNIYACRGPVRAHSKALYKDITLSSQSIADDMYTYLYAKTHNFSFKYVTNTHINFQVPENTSDHRKQGIRFFQSITKLEKKFGYGYIKKEFYVPFLFKAKQVLKSLAIDHIWIIIYLLLFLLNRVNKLFIPIANDDRWDRISVKNVDKRI